jgi:nitrogen regulatory protein P-II 1
MSAYEIFTNTVLFLVTYKKLLPCLATGISFANNETRFLSRQAKYPQVFIKAFFTYDDAVQVSQGKEFYMKRIEAIIRPSQVSGVCAALDKMGHTGVTISEVEGRGNQKGWMNHVRGKSFNVNLLAKSRVEVVVKDEDSDNIIKAIRDAALTGEVGDGKIFVHDMVTAIRIRTNETGLAAL